MTYLAQARALGASLVVAANTDASVKRLGKGDDRPLNAAPDRMAVLAALESVSLVVEFDEHRRWKSYSKRAPRFMRRAAIMIWPPFRKGQAVIAYGGQAVAIDFEHDRSTTKLLGKIRA